MHGEVPEGLKGGVVTPWPGGSVRSGTQGGLPSPKLFLPSPGGAQPPGDLSHCYGEALPNSFYCINHWVLCIKLNNLFKTRAAISTYELRYLQKSLHWVRTSGCSALLRSQTPFLGLIMPVFFQSLAVPCHSLLLHHVSLSGAMRMGDAKRCGCN